MAVGNIEAIRDWIGDNWYNKEEINDIITFYNGHWYDTTSPYYSKYAGTVCTSWYQQCVKTSDGECYSGILYAYNGTHSSWVAFCLSLSQETAKAMSYRYGRRDGTIIFESRTWYYSTDTDVQTSYGQNVDRTDPSSRKFYYTEGSLNVEEWLRGLLESMNPRK